MLILQNFRVHQYIEYKSTFGKVLHMVSKGVCIQFTSRIGRVLKAIRSLIVFAGCNFRVKGQKQQGLLLKAKDSADKDVNDHINYSFLLIRV